MSGDDGVRGSDDDWEEKAVDNLIKLDIILYIAIYTIYAHFSVSYVTDKSGSLNTGSLWPIANGQLK